MNDLFPLLTPDQSVLHLAKNVLMNTITQVCHRRVRSSQNHRRTIIRHLASRLGVDSSEIQFLPHELQQFINVPALIFVAHVRLEVSDANYLKEKYYKHIPCRQKWDNSWESCPKWQAPPS